jgi:ABC-2 type transport system permease protein
VNALRTAWTVTTAATRIGFADLAAIYTWRTWLLGWFVRLVTQAVFFSLFGVLLGSAAAAQYRAVGNTVVLVCIEATVVILSTVRERGSGTLALQVIAPAPFGLTYLARGLNNVVVGIGSSTAAFAIVALVFRIPVVLPWAFLAPVFIAVIGVSAYCYGLAIGSVVMRAPAVQWLALNLSYLSIMTICGVNVPVDYWPAPVRALADVLPLTHGLAALRLLLADGPDLAVLGQLGAELLVALGWLGLAGLLLAGAVRAGRRDGSLELAG